MLLVLWLCCFQNVFCGGCYNWKMCHIFLEGSALLFHAYPLLHFVGLGSDDKIFVVI
jgi:hypothetical protein